MLLGLVLETFFIPTVCTAAQTLAWPASSVGKLQQITFENVGDGQCLAHIVKMTQQLFD